MTAASSTKCGTANLLPATDTSLLLFYFLFVFSTVSSIPFTDLFHTCEFQFRKNEIQGFERAIDYSNSEMFLQN